MRRREEGERRVSRGESDYNNKSMIVSMSVYGYDEGDNRT